MLIASGAVRIGAFWSMRTRKRRDSLWMPLMWGGSRGEGRRFGRDYGGEMVAWWLRCLFVGPCLVDSSGGWCCGLFLTLFTPAEWRGVLCKLSRSPTEYSKGCNSTFRNNL